MMTAETAIAFVCVPREPPGVEIGVNFGVLSGREATRAEVDRLARQLLPLLGEVSIVSEQRYEVGAGLEVCLHQVRIEVAPARLPSEPGALEELTARVVALAEAWALDCAAERHAEVTEL